MAPGTKEAISNSIGSAGGDVASILRQNSIPKFLARAPEQTPVGLAATAPEPLPITPSDLTTPTAPIADPVPQPDPVTPAEPEYPTEAPKVEAAPAAPVPEGEPKPTPAESLVGLRKAKEAESKRAKDAEAQVSKLTKDLEEYKSGAVLPDVLQAKEAEIQRLSVFAKLHNLKTSPEYEEKFIKPLTQAETKLKAIAEDYGIPEATMMEAVKRTGSDLNGFLSSHFDSVGAMEVKQIVTSMQQLNAEIAIADKEPDKILSSIREEHKKIIEAKDIQRKSKIVSQSKTGWIKALTQVQNVDKLPELTIRENDTEHNEKVSKVVLNAASTEYGKIVRILGEHGLTELSDELSFVLAKMSMLAHAGATAHEHRNFLVSKLTELEKNTKRDAPHVRPPVGSPGVGTSGTAATPQPLPTSPKEAARGVLRQTGVIP